MRYPEQLRGAIDQGRTRDKISGGDPAAAPLGTDEEAAGTPISKEAVAMASLREIDSDPPREKKGGALIYLTVLAAVMIVLTLAVVYLSVGSG